MTRRKTSWPVAIAILVILGVVHLYWITLLGPLLSYAVMPEAWDSDGTPHGFVITLVIITILSFPMAFFILRLRPKRVLFYLTFALAPTVAFYVAMGIQLDEIERGNLQTLASFTLIPIGLLIAIGVLQRFQHGKSPNKSLEQPGYE